MRRPGRRRLHQGPAARMQAAFANLRQAQATGTPTEQFDARDFADRMQAAYEKALKRQGAAFGGGRGGAAGLARGITQATDAFGRFGLAVKGVQDAFNLMTSHIRMTAEALGSFSREAGLAGATSRETAAFAAMTGGTEGFAARARELTERLKTDLYAQQAAGVAIPRGPFGPTNEGQLLMSQLEALRAMAGDETAQLRKARALGLEWALEHIRVSDAVWDARKKLEEQSARLASPENLAAVRDFAAWQNIIGQRFQNMVTEVSIPSIKAFNRAMENLDRIFAKLTPAADAFNSALDDMLGKLLGGGKTRGQQARQAGFEAAMIPGGILGWFHFFDKLGQMLQGKNPFLPGKKGPADPSQAQNSNTQAIQDLTEMLRQIAGGGVRARAALPPALWSAANRQAAIDASLDLRGFRGF